MSDAYKYTRARDALFYMRGDMWTDVVFLTNFLLYIFYFFNRTFWHVLSCVCEWDKWTQIQMKNKFMGCAWKLVSIQKWFYAFFNDSHNYFLCFFYRVLSRYVLFIFCIFFMNMWRFFFLLTIIWTILMSINFLHMVHLVYLLWVVNWICLCYN